MLVGSPYRAVPLLALLTLLTLLALLLPLPLSWPLDRSALVNQLFSLTDSLDCLTGLIWPLFCGSLRQGQEPEKFFVSAGFALTHPTSVTDITAIEAVRVEELDEGAVSVV